MAILIRMLAFCCLAEAGEDEYTIACLLMVFVAVAIPRLARSDAATFKAALEGLTLHFIY